MQGSRPRRLVGGIVAAVVVMAAAAFTVVQVLPGPPKKPPPKPICLASTPTGTYSLDFDQAANATTIAAVARRLGLPDHAVTVGLGAALQESGLHNLDHGDRDSLGLFQQRPSQGWGTPQQILTPTYAAEAFFRHLARVAGWEALPLTEAAQRVQHSAAPDAYADWEDQARVIATLLTGEEPAGFTCRYTVPQATPAQARTNAAALHRQLVTELGVDPTRTGLTQSEGWTAATWIVGHARQYGIRSVTYGGMRWTPAHLAWRADPAAGTVVRTEPAI